MGRRETGIKYKDQKNIFNILYCLYVAKFWQQGEEGLYRDGLCKKNSGATFMLDWAIWRWLEGGQRSCGASVIPGSAMGYFTL